MIQKLFTMSGNHYLLIACICMFGGQLCVWFGTNSQIVWRVVVDKAHAICNFVGNPATLFFLAAFKSRLCGNERIVGSTFFSRVWHGVLSYFPAINVVAGK